MRIVLIKKYQTKKQFLMKIIDLYEKSYKNGKRIFIKSGGFALIDDEDYPWVSKYIWFEKKGNRTVYAIRRNKRKHINVSMQDEIMDITREVARNGFLIHHINGNGADN